VSDVKRSASWLARQADACGLVLEEHVGKPLGYFARFRPADL
jgi:hypothetical protein